MDTPKHQARHPEPGVNGDVAGAYGVCELNQILHAKYHLEAPYHDGKDATIEDIDHLVDRVVEDVQMYWHYRNMRHRWMRY